MLQTCKIFRFGKLLQNFTQKSQNLCQFPIITDNSDHDVHINPDAHQKLLDAPVFQENPNQKLLKVCVLGIPNAGKSTLINQLTGSNPCPYSKKANTTRISGKAILTQGDTQIVFNDTPGVVKPSQIKKFKLESSFVFDPINSANSADVILVLQGNKNCQERTITPQMAVQ